MEEEMEEESTVESLSARRAWIEMTLTVRNVPIDSVALRKESVDRNAGVLFLIDEIQLSLSARRAWIEICLVGFAAINAESRSPQGERG